MTCLCVNIDHVATLRQARGGDRPDPVEAARICEACGVSGITVHLREDRRHIQDDDVIRLGGMVTTMLNLEMAATEEMVSIALERRPGQVTLVPERREELTTEGGLDVAGSLERIRSAVQRLQDAGIPVSLFIDPEAKQVEASAASGAKLIELHTGAYANAEPGEARRKELEALVRGAAQGRSLGLVINAGHGLDLENVGPVVAIEDMHELNIGHSIVSHAVMVGMEHAVQSMMKKIEEACGGA